VEVEEFIGSEDGMAKRGQSFQSRGRNILPTGREQAETLFLKDLFRVGGEIQIELGWSFLSADSGLIYDPRCLADCGG
jgi:hypothetical protein